MGKKELFILGTVQCRIIGNIKAKPEGKAIAPEAVVPKVGKGNFLQIIGPERFCGVANMGLGSENPGFAKLEDLFEGGALKGRAGMIVQTAIDNGIDPKLFAAIIAHETGRGTSNAVENYNNPAGIMDPKTKWTRLKKFESLQDGLNFSAKNLKRRLDEVDGDVSRLANVYAPIGAENDPNDLNKNWLNGVNKFYNLLATTEKPLENAVSENTLLAR